VDICCILLRFEFATNSAEFGSVSCHRPCLSKIWSLAKREMNLLEHISDPTDFEDASLRALDMAIRCPVCKEVVNNPAMTPCGHSFCSLVCNSHLWISSEADMCPVHTVSSLCHSRMSILSRKVHRRLTQAEYYAGGSCASLPLCKVCGDHSSRRGYFIVMQAEGLETRERRLIFSG
jgi:hypothetical protein